jgi:hypothetical protein
MRGYLVDSERQTIEEIDSAFEIEDMCRLLGCQIFTNGSRPLRGNIEDGFDVVYVSDDDLLEGRDDQRFWFQVDADRNPPSSHPIAGNGLVMGCDPEGKACDVQIAIDEVRARVTFTRRRFRGFEQRINDDGIIVTITAPIIGDEA